MKNATNATRPKPNNYSHIKSYNQKSKKLVRESELYSMRLMITAFCYN